MPLAVLGTNDANVKGWNRKTGESEGYQSAMGELVNGIKGWTRCMLIAPPPVWRDGACGIKQAIVNTVLPALLATTASDLGCEFVNVYQRFRDQQVRMPRVVCRVDSPPNPVVFRAGVLDHRDNLLRWCARLAVGTAGHHASGP